MRREEVLLSTSECPLILGYSKDTCMRVLTVPRKEVLLRA